jgi:hypothetical protein
MPTLLFQSETPVHGTVWKFVVLGPSLEAIRALVDAQKPGTPGMRYKPYLLQDSPQTPAMIVCTEIAAPVLDPAHVQGGQPTAAPVGQRGRDVPDPRAGLVGFSAVPDDALPAVADDSVFGDARDGTYCDLYSDGSELARPDAKGGRP